MKILPLTHTHTRFETGPVFVSFRQQIRVTYSLNSQQGPEGQPAEKQHPVGSLNSVEVRFPRGGAGFVEVLFVVNHAPLIDAIVWGHVGRDLCNYTTRASVSELYSDRSLNRARIALSEATSILPQ